MIRTINLPFSGGTPLIGQTIPFGESLANLSDLLDVIKLAQYKVVSVNLL